MNIKRIAVVVLIGLLISGLALLLLQRFVHTSSAATYVSYFIVPSFLALSYAGKTLSEASFWTLFILGQSLYAVLLYVLFEFVIQKKKGHGAL